VTQPIRVATIPFSDPYVDAVLPADVVRVVPSGTPSAWLEPWHLAAHADDVDVVHLHTGYDHRDVAELEEWAETLRRLGIPLVATVHQLPDPADPDVELHQARLAAVLGSAEVVLTLTPGAADEVADRFGRTAIVVACPSLATPHPELGAERGLVGVRIGAPSSAVPDPVELVRAALSGAVSGGGRLRVLAAPGAPGDLEALLAGVDAELVRPAAGEWSAALQQLHVAVLPEVCGSHSRDLEICRDVGTRVVAPRCGWFAEQWSEVVPYGTAGDGGPDPVSLAAAVGAALTQPMPRPADRVWREGQAAAEVRVHRDVYAQVLADRTWAVTPGAERS
jgi:hypothetical protein